tara:strand:+ start:14689 stop:14931 length:243 start_codon:yes stop_codon:yes gene_type:complete
VIRSAGDLYSGVLMDYKELPDSICEHMLAKAYGWDLDYISKLHPKKFHEHMSILLVEYRMSGKGSVSGSVQTQQKSRPKS